MKHAEVSAASRAELLAGIVIDGFQVGQVTPLPELRATAVRAMHIKSGARIMHLFAPGDSENCFGVIFPTPPPDDTGLPHILEHSVLGGSRKFPVREPFFEMVKMSMATFINAMTSQAYTVYPVASNVKKDFFNLAEVYLDAVFHPLLTAETFRREGHHLALENNSDLTSPLKISGIVYSEMKGATSIPEQMIWQLSSQGLFPDTSLGRDSGGDPEHIPNLTYDQFLDFHRNLYHPANGLFFIYGDIPTEEHLRFLAPVLNAFDRREALIVTPRQPRWTAPRKLEREYPIGRREDASSRAFIALHWIVGDALDPAQVVEWKVLSALLFGNEAAPLKKTLIDSRLGSDLFIAGASGHAYEEVFHIGIKGSEPDRADSFERLVLETLERLADDTFAGERVEAAFQQVAYETLEVTTLFPLKLLFAVSESWPFNADPLTFLESRRNLDGCCARYASDPRLFNKLIRAELLENPHRLLVVLRPDCEAQARTDATFTARMADMRARLSSEQVSEIAKSAAELTEVQGVRNSPEALAGLPQLKISDLPAAPRRISTSKGRIAGITVLHNDVFANGINYLDIDMDIAGLPADLYRWLPVFTDAVSKMGAAGGDFIAIAERRSACTGGLWSHASVSRHAFDPATNLRRFRFGFKTLDGQAEKALKLLGDLIFTVDPRDHERLRDVLIQQRTALRTSLMNNGLGTSMNQARRGFSEAAALNHQFFSPDALRFIEELTNLFDQRVDEIMLNIERIRDFLALRARWTASFTGSEPVFRAVTKSLEDWSSRRLQPVGDAAPQFQPLRVPIREGLAGEMKIAHCVKAMPAPHLAHPDVPLFQLGLYLAQFDYFYPEIRFKGNAYGGGGSYDDTLGAICLYSFNDPRIVETLEVFDRLRDHVAVQQWSRTDIDRAIIGNAKEVEKPIRPGAANGAALTRHVRGDTDEMREARYAAKLRATPESVKETTLRVLDANEPASAVCVVSSREKLDEANKLLGDKLLAISGILVNHE